jgi:hypothetical protein
MIDNDINKIINRLNYIMTNEEKKSLSDIGGEIVGMIGALDNISIIYEHFPMLEVIANRGTELKLTTDEMRSKQLHAEIQASLDELRRTISVR